MNAEARAQRSWFPATRFSCSRIFAQTAPLETVKPIASIPIGSRAEHEIVRIKAVRSVDIVRRDGGTIRADERDPFRAVSEPLKKARCMRSPRSPLP
jgi:hypothetical protein